MYELEYDTKHIEEGSVIIFPSALPHSVISTDHKVSISFNIQCLITVMEVYFDDK